MNGFINESVSKIADGFGSAFKLIAFVFFVTLAVIPVNAMFGLYGIAGLLVLLLILSIFYFQRSFHNTLEENQKAWCGMAAGVLFWQVTRYLPEIPGMGWVSSLGLLYWTVIAVLTFVLWKSVLRTGLRFFLLSFLLNWIGWIYLNSIQQAVLLPGLLSGLYSSLHYVGILGILFSIWWIVVRSHNTLERKYAGLALYFSIMFTFLIF